MGFPFGKDRRVVRRAEFTRALRKGASAADGTLVLFALPAAGNQAARLGITIPKKAGNAVVRNRWKRLIRESFRRQLGQIPCGYDYIVRPKKGAVPDWPAIRSGLPKLARRAVTRTAKRSRNP